MPERLPIVILGGSDLQTPAVPSSLSADQMLTGFKGAIPLPWGRCLVAELIERIRASDRFQEPLLVGPQRVYRDLIETPVVNVEGDLAGTLQTVVEEVRCRWGSRGPVALITCDILPSGDDFRHLLDEGYLPYQTSLFWTQLVRATPDQMGASGWKPAYQLRPSPQQPPQNVYPGHLVIVRPHAIRLDLTIHLLRLAYRYRNRALNRRHIQLTWCALARLLHEDVQDFRRLELPLVTASVLFFAWSSYYRYRLGRATVADLERAVEAAFAYPDACRRAGADAVVFHLTDRTSFAKDIDTREELAEMAGVPTF